MPFRLPADPGPKDEPVPKTDVPDARPMRRSWFSHVLTAVKWMAVGIAALAVGGVIFIKLDTPAAAELTDNYLRPILGDDLVIYLEKIFFNSSDNVAQIVSQFKAPAEPQFTEPRQTQTEPSNLDLGSIPPDFALPPLDGEGVWTNMPLAVFPDREAMAYTFIRPDPTRSFAIVYLVQMDSTLLGIGSVAGTKEPGGAVGKPGPGVVPKPLIQSGNLIAAFDGGFQYRDGAYGMIVGDTTYLPLKNGLGTVIGQTDGTADIVNYAGQALGKNIAFVRQNGPMLIEDGAIVVTKPDSHAIWGRVVGSGSYTWRSGIGITKTGKLLYAAGNNLSPVTLATALQMAGAVKAIQLDINPYWVRFNIFNSTGSGKYDSFPLTKDMQDGSKQYLNGYQKDFFYVYKK